MAGASAKVPARASLQFTPADAPLSAGELPVRETTSIFHVASSQNIVACNTRSSINPCVRDAI